MRRVLVVQHVPHERLGGFEEPLTRAGCALRPFNAADPKAAWPRPDELDAVVVMGGPQSVYRQAAYPFLKPELAFLKRVVAEGLPVLGVCLGAQLLAAVLGAKVAAAPQKEIGWYPVMREPGADGDVLCEPFGSTETVFQWHGDAFALPTGAVRLFSSPLCPEQGFRYRDRVYGLQFHLEVTEALVRAWMRTPVNHTELKSLRGIIDPMAIRRQSSQHAARLQELARHVAGTFATQIISRRAT